MMRAQNMGAARHVGWGAVGLCGFAVASFVAMLAVADPVAAASERADAPRPCQKVAMVNGAAGGVYRMDCGVAVFPSNAFSSMAAAKRDDRILLRRERGAVSFAAVMKQRARAYLRFADMRRAFKIPMPPAITQAIQRPGDPLPVLDPRPIASGRGLLQLAADAPMVRPNQPSPEDRAGAPSGAGDKIEEPPVEEAPVDESPGEGASGGTAPDAVTRDADALAPDEQAVEADVAPRESPRLSSPPFDPPAPEDREAILSCKAREGEAGRSGEACIGGVSNPCAEQAASDEAATNACVERETRVWVGKLDESVALLAARLNPDQARQLSQTQESWVDFRQRNCAFYNAFYDGPLARSLAGYCIMRETARRSIEIDSLLTQAEQL